MNSFSVLPTGGDENLEDLISTLSSFKYSMKLPTFTLNQLVIMLLLFKHGTIENYELKKRYLLGTASLSRTIDTLSELGIAKRERLPGDARRTVIHITGYGKDLIEKAISKRSDLITKF